MPTVEAVALTDFTHDNINARNGRVIERLDEQLALELERAGLVRIRVSPLRGRRIIGVEPGKVQAAGEVQPPSSSQAARASTPTTLPSSVRGATPIRRAAR